MNICACDKEVLRDSLKLLRVRRSRVVKRVPGYYWHGTKTVNDMPSLTVTLLLASASTETQIRRGGHGMDSEGVVLVEINGKCDDHICGNLWN